jgi:hypothetical protein
MLELVTRLLIDLSQQRLTAYGVGPAPIYSALVSTAFIRPHGRKTSANALACPAAAAASV